MVAAWVIDEMGAVDLKDRRLDARLREVLSQLAARPTASIPAACGGRAEMTAAYRLFDNDNVSFDNILQSHQEATQRRIAEQSLVILAQDTTQVDLTRPEQQVAGAGPLDVESRRGVLLHALHAFTPDGTPLGTLSAATWVRSDEKTPDRLERIAQRRKRPIEAKESQRWIDAWRSIHATAQVNPQTRMIGVADSEADIYELMVEGMSEPRAADWIVRACQDRALKSERIEAEPTSIYLREQLLKQPVLFMRSIQVRGRRAKLEGDQRSRRRARVSRKAEVEVRAAQVTLRPPWRAGGKLPTISVNVILVQETNPPADDVAVEWLLLTSLPITTAEEVRQVIEYYCVRWMIEVFFRTLKSGCRAEERRFETLDRQRR